MTTLRDFVSNLFHYRMTTGETKWDMFSHDLEKSGLWSITASPRKFQDIILELCKRIEKLEEHEAVQSPDK
jgi:hypothetical protein